MNRFLLIAALIAAIGFGGYRLGVKIEQGRQAEAVLQAEAEADRSAEVQRIATAAWLRERDGRLELERQLNDEARQDPDAARPALGPASVQRLNAVR